MTTFKNLLLQNYWAYFNQTWHKVSLGEGNSGFFQMKGPILLQGEIIMKKRKYIDEIQKSSSPEPLSQFQPNLAQPLMKGIQVCSNEGPCSFPRGDNYEIVKFKNLLLHWTTEPFSIKHGTKHPWMKGIQICTYELSRPSQMLVIFAIKKRYCLIL